MINDPVSSPISFFDLAQSLLWAEPSSASGAQDAELCSDDSGAVDSAMPPPERPPELNSLPFFDRILPPIDGPRQELLFAGKRSLARVGLEGLFGAEHKAYSAIGVGANVYAIALAMAHYAMLVGARDFISQYCRHAATQEHLPVDSNGFIGIARRHFLHGIEIYARALGLDVVIEGKEMIPRDGMVIQLAANHSSIFPDFLFAWADERFAPVADVDNFSYDWLARRSGAALYFDLLGLPFIKREKRGDKAGGDAQRRATATDELSQRLISLMTELGVRPIFFGQGGRTPTAYNDDGSQAPAGFYGNAPDRRKPEVYFQAGGVIIAASRVARKTGRDVSLVLVSMKGGEMVMPKHAAKSFPFVGTARVGQRVVYRVVDVITISPEERRLGAIAARATDLLRRDLGIDAYLEEVVGKWAALEGKPELGAQYARLAADDERLRIIADRIRSVHPRSPKRAIFSRQLLGLICELAEGSVDGDALSEMLAEVTAAIR